MITNILLSFLIALLSFMGKAMYDNIEKLIDEIRRQWTVDDADREHNTISLRFSHLVKKKAVG